MNPTNINKLAAQKTDDGGMIINGKNDDGGIIIDPPRKDDGGNIVGPV